MKVYLVPSGKIKVWRFWAVFFSLKTYELDMEGRSEMYQLGEKGQLQQMEGRV